MAVPSSRGDQSAVRRDRPEEGRSISRRLLRLAGARRRERRRSEQEMRQARSLFLFNRGVLMSEEGLRERSISDFREVVDLGDADFAPKAAFNIGVLSLDPIAAAEAYEWAMATRHPDVALKAAANLVELEHHSPRVRARSGRF